MGLQVGRLISDRPIGRAVRFVETVACKLVDQFKQVGRLLVRHAVLLRPFQEVTPVLVDFRELLLGDGLNALVRAGEFNPAQAVQDAHHLFLVHHHAIGLGENGVHDGMDLGDVLATVFAVDIGRDHAAFQRTGAIQGRCRDDILELVGLHLGQQVTHPAGFQLEDALRFAPLEQSESGLVIEWQVFRHDVDTAMPPHILDCAVQDCEVSQTQKVHLEQTGFFDIGPLRQDVVASGNLLERDVLIQRSVGDHNTGGVCARTLGQPFEGHRKVDHLSDLRVFVVLGLEFGTFGQSVLELDVQLFRDHLGDDISAFQIDTQCAANIADSCLGFEGAEGSDLGDVGVSVFLFHILND